jgi:dihydroceramide fatty acyl 2-hydroxylase
MRSRRLHCGIRLFDNPLLDWGSRVHPALPALFWTPLAVVFLVWGAQGLGSAYMTFAWFAAGYIAWIFAEYAIHRWFFHFCPRNAWLRSLLYYVHEHHHRFQERDRLLAPPLLSLSIGAVLVLTLTLTIVPLVGDRALCVLLSGLVTAYLVYDYTHFIIHFTKPRTRWGRYLRRCHLEHHFRAPDRWFCISWPWLDYLFRTHGGQKSTAGHSSERIQFGEWDIQSLPAKVRAYEEQWARDPNDSGKIYN